MDPDKLEDLVRQRRLIEDHLRWLDRQIAEAGGTYANPAAKIPVAGETPAHPSQSPIEETLPLPSLDRKNIQRSIAKGCAFYLAVAALLILLLWLVYHLATR